MVCTQHIFIAKPRPWEPTKFIRVSGKDTGLMMLPCTDIKVINIVSNIYTISMSLYVCLLRHHGIVIQKPPTDGLYTTHFHCQAKAMGTNEVHSSVWGRYGFDDVAMHRHYSHKHCQQYFAKSGKDLMTETAHKLCTISTRFHFLITNIIKVTKCFFFYLCFRAASLVLCNCIEI